MYVRFDRDPAVLGLSLAAEAVYQRALRWCKDTRTGGVIPKDCLVTLSRRVPNVKAVAAELVACGLWGEQAKFYTVRSFSKWNMDEPDFGEYTTEKSKSGSWGNHRRWHAAPGRKKPDTCEHCAAEAIATDRTSDRTSDRTCDPGCDPGCDGDRRKCDGVRDGERDREGIAK
jgi:hypothetical protein